MTRRYIRMTRKAARGYLPGGTPIELEWKAISPMTQDPAIRQAMPGDYAIVGDVVYIVPQIRPEQKKNKFSRR